MELFKALVLFTLLSTVRYKVFSTLVFQSHCPAFVHCTLLSVANVSKCRTKTVPFVRTADSDSFASFRSLSASLIPLPGLRAL